MKRGLSLGLVALTALVACSSSSSNDTGTTSDSSVGGSGGSAASSGSSGAGGSSGASGGVDGGTLGFCASQPENAFCADFDTSTTLPFVTVLQMGGVLQADTGASKSAPRSLLASTTSSGPVFAHGIQVLPLSSTFVVLEADVFLESMAGTAAAGLLRIVFVDPGGSHGILLTTNATGTSLNEVLELDDDAGPGQVHAFALTQPLPTGSWFHVEIKLNSLEPSATVSLDGTEALSTPLDPSWTQSAPSEIWIDVGIIFAEDAGWSVRFDNLLVANP